MENIEEKTTAEKFEEKLNNESPPIAGTPETLTAIGLGRLFSGYFNEATNAVEETYSGDILECCGFFRDNCGFFGNVGKNRDSHFAEPLVRLQEQISEVSKVFESAKLLEIVECLHPSESDPYFDQHVFATDEVDDDGHAIGEWCNPCGDVTEAFEFAYKLKFLPEFKVVFYQYLEGRITFQKYMESVL